MITYGGVTLQQYDAGLAAYVQSQFDLASLVEFARISWPGARRMLWACPDAIPDVPVRINTLHWPTNCASRFAVFHGLATDDEVRQLRKQAYSTASANNYTSLKLRLGEGIASIETQMWMLPPRPLAQISDVPENQLYLLTLVDDRFWWWSQAASIVVTGGTTTWSSLFSSIGTALGVTITPDTISGSYGYPSETLTSQYEYLPLLLDAVCYNVGHRLVRKLDGTVITQLATTALASQNLQLTKWSKQAGGLFAFNPTG